MPCIDHNERIRIWNDNVYREEIRPNTSISVRALKRVCQKKMMFNLVKVNNLHYT